MNRRLPAEWEKHQTTLLCFPHDGKDWPGKYQAIKWTFVDLIKKMAKFEPVLLAVKNVEFEKSVSIMLERAHVDIDNVHFVHIDTNRSWMRDSGPIVVKTKEDSREAIEFRFNAWAKYKNYKKDIRIPQAIAEALNIPLVKAVYKGKPVVLEGGAIDVNGCGTLITTEECLLDQSIQTRNKGFSKADYEYIFKEYLGVSNSIWLGEGIEGDDTHGHVDDICRFVNKNTVVICREENKSDVNHPRLEDNYRRLQDAVLENGEKLNIVSLPMPERIDFDGLRLPASYANFIYINDCLLVPTFNDKNDKKTLDILSEQFEDRHVIGIHAVDLIWGLGTLHCLSHEIGI